MDGVRLETLSSINKCVGRLTQGSWCATIVLSSLAKGAPDKAALQLVFSVARHMATTSLHQILLVTVGACYVTQRMGTSCGAAYYRNENATSSILQTMFDT